MESTATLGKYRLLAEIGRGGMAKVFLAVANGPAGFNKLVVIKEIQAQLAEDPEFVNMFLDEARLAARLNHPNVVQTNEVGQEGQSYFMAMEYLEGQPLNRIINKIGPTLSLAMQLRVVSESLAGLHHAHELRDFDGKPLSVVHRDISPHNIFVTYSGQVKVVDFGIAKALNQSSETRTGVMKGKVAYMSPEQARCERVDRRADVFSVGVVLWQLVTGKRMFKGVPELAVLRKLLDGDVPRIRDEFPEIDPKLEPIIQKALAPRPEDRHATAAELQADLDAFLEGLEDRRGCKDVGRLAAQAFSEDRRRVESLIEEELKGATERRLDELPLIQIAPMSMTGESQMFSPATARQVNPLSISQSSPPSAVHSANPTTITSVTMPGGTPTSPKTVQAKRSFTGFAVAALLVGGAVAVGVIGFRTPETPPGAAATSPPPGPKGTFALRITSTPDHATVREGDRVLGSTPLEVAVSAADTREFTVLLDGHQPAKLKAGPFTGDSTVVAALQPAGQGAAATAAATSASPPPAPTSRQPLTRHVPVTKATGKTTAAAPGESDIRLNR